MNNSQIETILTHYLVCMLWSTSGDDCEPLDEKYSVTDISQETKDSCLSDIIDFINLLERENVEWSQRISLEAFGHDFWLTRNGHGAGFWDRGLVVLGDKLTKYAETFSEEWPYVGDDGKIYI